jgi:anthranilate phosphoribosyltransferase
MSAVRKALHQAVAGRDLSEQRANAAMLEILGNRSTPALTAALLTALRMKGETTGEVTGFARAMRASALQVRPRSASARELVDTCGTGGDGGATFNVSTAAALVAAGAGLSVAKHGNRSISSQCGSADVLEALGVNVNLDAEQAARSIDEVGIGFLFAPGMHPAMRYAGPVRSELGMRTVFNMLGPLTNPAGAATQVMGVYEDRIVTLAAEALARLGARHALVVHGSDGMDEITVAGPTRFAEVRDGSVLVGSLEPADFGLAAADTSGIAGGDTAKNASIVRAVLAGRGGPARDIVLMNAGAAIRMAGRAGSWREAAGIAADSIDSGAASAKLGRLAEFTREIAGPS